MWSKAVPGNLCEMRQGGVAAVALVVMAAATAALSLVLHRPVLGAEPLFVVANTATAVAMVSLGGYLSLRQRERFTGRCFMVAGVSWLFVVFDIYPGWGPWIAFVFGPGATFYAPLSWGALRFGRRRLAHRAERVYLGLCAFFVSGAPALYSLFVLPQWIGLAGTVAWPRVWPNRHVASYGGIVLALGYVFIAGQFMFVARGALQEMSPLRREASRPLYVFAPVLAVGSALIFGFATVIAHAVLLHSVIITVAALALTLTAGLFMAILRENTWAARLVELLPSLRTPDTITAYLRRALHDDTAELLFVDASGAGLIDIHGRPHSGEHGGTEEIRQWIRDGDGQPVALLIAGRALAQETPLLTSARGLLSVLAENTRLQAVVRAQLESIRAAHSRIVEVGLTERRRLERNLHDGAQQSLLAAATAVELARQSLTDQAAAPALNEAVDRIREALAELRELAHGLHPRTLSRDGLAAAVAIVAQRAPIPVELHIEAPQMPEVIEATAYYIVSEAITNIAKHAHASAASVRIVGERNHLLIAISDDGQGGARQGSGLTGQGSGIIGMADRVHALGGQFHLVSTPGDGTHITVKVPCHLPRSD
jgi:signal transduction histidine kinase